MTTRVKSRAVQVLTDVSSVAFSDTGSSICWDALTAHRDEASDAGDTFSPRDWALSLEEPCPPFPGAAAAGNVAATIKYDARKSLLMIA
jgi:hypothetical protein